MGIENNALLDSSPGTDLYRPIMIMIGGHRGGLERDIGTHNQGWSKELSQPQIIKLIINHMNLIPNTQNRRTPAIATKILRHNTNTPPLYK